MVRQIFICSGFPVIPEKRWKKEAFYFSSIRNKACIAITGAIEGTSRERLYHELDLKSLGH